MRFNPNDLERFITERKTNPPPLQPLPKLDLPLREYDRLFLKGGVRALRSNSRRWNYSIGSISVRKTKNGHDRWYLDYRSGQGERRREVAKLARTRGEALIALQAKVGREFNREFGAPGRSEERLEFNEFANRYLSEYADNVKKSASTDRYRLRSIRETFGKRELAEVSRTMILEFRQGRLKQGISKATTNRELMLLGKMFSWGQEQGYAQANPVRGIKKFSEADMVRSRVLSEKEQKRLMSELAPHARILILTALHTGLRYHELLNLPWRSVDLEKRRLKVEGTKSGKARFVPINSLLLEVLVRLKPPAASGSCRVFPFKNVRTAFENACRRAKVEDFHFHDLRRTFGTRLLENGVDIVTISRLLGHSSVLVTQRYLHPSDLLSDEAVEKLAVAGRKEADLGETLSNGGQTKRSKDSALPPSPFESVN